MNKNRNAIIYRNLTPTGSGYMLVFANLLFIIGIIFFDWSGYAVIAAYFLETILLGAINIIKMFIISIAQPGPTPKKKRVFKDFKMYGIAGILFFIFHFGMFVGVQLVIFIRSGMDIDNTFPYRSPGFIPNIYDFFKQTLPADGGLFLAVLLGSHLFYFVSDFIIKKEFKTITFERQMMFPYVRVIIQQFVVIIGGFILMIGRGGAAIAIFLIILKTMADLWAHNRHLQKKIPVTAGDSEIIPKE